MKILGIDPGSARIGFGLIQKEGGNLKYIKSGLIQIDPERKKRNYHLLLIERAISSLIRKTKPEKIGLEKLFFSKNRKTAIEVAQARGVIIQTIVKMAIPLYELSPSEIKLAVAGDGRASKNGVAKMAKIILKLPPDKKPDDETDALAIAIAASNQRIHNPHQ